MHEGVTAGRWAATPVLGVSNVRMAAEYYRDVLGFTLDPGNGMFALPDGDPGGVYGIVRRDGIEIHFQFRRDVPRDGVHRTGEACDVYVRVPDVEAVHAELTRRGAQVEGPPRNAFYGLRELRVEDLNGYRLTFGAPIG